MALDRIQIAELLDLLDGVEFREIEIETDEMRLIVRRGDAGDLKLEQTAPAAPPPPVEKAPVSPPAGAAPAPTDGQPDGDDIVPIVAPVLGAFYRAEKPGERPLVEVGDGVEPDSQVCIIEVMKLMQGVQAGVAGTVVEICAGNGELVEYGEVLFKVRQEDGK